MRLLHLTGDGKLSLTKELIEGLPPYAILSHTWGHEDEEVTFQDLRDRPSEASTKVGFRKIMFCAEQAARDNLQYIWVDTCCIDKSNNTELSEAINSMFRWYREAKRCYVYLADVSVHCQSKEIHMSLGESSFRKSRWFTRGWTLQELIAPPAVEFFSMEGTPLGDKKSLELQVHELTGIAIQALRGCSLSEFSVADRMAWADTRTTTRQEDKAYSLLGIFDVSMPLIYGEGEEKAFHRLRGVIAALESELDLPFAVEAPFNAYERQHEPTCFENTRVDLLRDIYDWADGPDGACIFWLNGQAGTGKSTIARTIARNYDENRRLGASFFFVKGGGDISHADKFVTTIAAQLARRVPALNRHICEAAAERKDIASQSLLDQWRHLVIRPLLKLNLDGSNLESSYVLVVDALDECDNENNIRIIPQLLAEVRSLEQVRLRIFLTSRPEVPIRAGFSHVPDPEHQDFVLHSILPQKVDHDIQVFWEHELSLIGQELSLGPGWPPDDAIRCLVQRAAGLFIWAATCSRFIRQGRRFAVKRLETIISSGGSSIIAPEKHLDEIYITVLKQTIFEEYTEEEKEELYCMLRQILGSIVLLYSPLSVQSLSKVLSIESRDISQSLGDLHSVLDIPKDHTQMLRIHHPSFRDFLLNSDRCTDPNFLVDDKKAHQALTYHCLRLMSASLKQDVCTIGKPGVLVTEVESRHIQSSLPPDVQYACLYWTRHLQNSCMQLSDNDQVHRFLQEHLLHWLEALAWIGMTPEGVRMICTLESLSAGRNCSQLRGFVSDAKRFILYSRAVIEQAPIQTYCSALVFAPLMSIVRKQFEGCMARWIQNLPKVRVHWKALVQTLESRSPAHTMAFSDELLAVGSSDGAIRLWEISSGALLQTIRGHSDHVIAVAFSDGQLASVSDDQTIKLWNPSLGTLLKTFKVNLDSHSRVAFSKSLLASASSHFPVKIWDINSGALLRTLTGQSNKDSCLAFSSVGHLARSYENTIKIWNASSGALLRMLECRLHTVKAIAFSQDDKLLASALSNHSINIWDTSSGAILRILHGHWFFVSALAFSPDSSLLASASEFGSIKLSESSSGEELLSKRAGDSNGVIDLAFSLDGKLLASVSKSSIQLWNANFGAVKTPTLEGPSDLVTVAAFSLNGNVCATSSSYGETIKLWDAGSGEVLGTLKGTILVKGLAFSPDGRLLASASSNGTIMLWDISSGAVLYILQEIASIDAALAFSPDGRLLASGSSNETIRLWDFASNTVLRTLVADLYRVIQITFSPDGKLIASKDKYSYKLWDVSSGRVLRTLQRPYEAYGEISFSDDGSVLQQNGKSIYVISGKNPGMNPTNSVSIDREWVLWGTERLLWLPLEYRSQLIEVHRDSIAICFSSGHVVFIKFAFKD